MSWIDWWLSQGYEPKPSPAPGVALLRKESDLIPGCVIWKAKDADTGNTFGQWVRHRDGHGHAFLWANAGDHASWIINRNNGPGEHSAWLDALSRCRPTRAKGSGGLPGGAL